jgi:signal transduction histidine kinase
MARLVDDLLALARLEAPAASRCELDLGRLAAEAGAEFAALAERRGLKLERSLASGLKVTGDRDALKRAIANLLDNAVRLAPAGSSVQLAAERDNGWAAVRVTDHGPGIALADQGQVFERFWRADPARTRASGGSGLGLAIVRRIAESHGGEVALVSAPGAGSTFSVRLPAAL